MPEYTSRNTVSKALKNDEIVLAATRKKIILKAYEMGYQKLKPLEEIETKKCEIEPDAGKKYVILMNGYAGDYFWNGIVWGITERIKEQNGNCLLVFVSKEEEKRVLPSLLRNQCLQKFWKLA